MSGGPDSRDDDRLIGHFKVIGALGEGGMGTVYLGLDEKLDRRVALKVIRREQRLDPVRKARFLREARILSRLDHPNICQLHDYLDTGGEDCLVLELVEGTNLRRAMDDGLDEARKMAIAEQLLGVLAAVHGHGVIHRDLKPENIMVGGDGAIKVLDFGLARPVGDPEAVSGAHRTLDVDGPALEDGATLPGEPAGARRSDPAVTTVGTVLGTIGYMSPEVARGEPATAASDLYSVGLILHELFTGRPPFPADIEPAERHRRAMWAETEPLTGLSPEITAFIRRLESLVPENRPSAIDAAEMLRAIGDRPRLRRRRRLVAAVWAVLALFGVGMTVQFLRAEKEARRAEEEAATARETSDFLVRLFEQASPRITQGEEVTVRELLQRGAEAIAGELADQPAVRARMLHTLGTVQHHLGQFGDAAPLLEEALALRRQALPESDPEVVVSLEALGLLRRAEGRYDEAQALFEEALVAAEVDSDRDPGMVAGLLVGLAGIDQDRGRWNDAEPRLTRAVAILESQRDGVALGLTDALYDLAALNRKLGRLPEAERFMLRCLELDEKEFGPQSEQVAGDLGELSAIASNQERYLEAEELARRSLEIRRRIFGSKHPYVGHSSTSLGFVLAALGRSDEAAAAFHRALEIYREAYGDDHPYVGDVLHSLGKIAAERGELDEAARLFLESLAVTESSRGPDHPLVADTMHHLAVVWSDQGRFDDALGLFERALLVREAVYGPAGSEAADTRKEYAECLRRAGRPDEAAEIEARARPRSGPSDSGSPTVTPGSRP